MRLTRIAVIALLGIVLVATIACGSSSTSNPTATPTLQPTLITTMEPTPTPTLAETDWRLTSWSVRSLDPSQFTIMVAFDDSQIFGTSAVNSYSGTYSAKMSGDFSVGELQSTQMAGSDDAMHAERIYFELLKQARKYTVNETTLTLLDNSNNALLVFTKK